jgi:hypothetical protein
MLRSSPPGFTPNRARHDDAFAGSVAGRWFRQPVLWLGALIFVASLLGCVVTIVLAWRYADTPFETTGAGVMKVPTEHRTDAGPAERAAP